MLQPTRVLPSNAPPLLDGDVYQASRVLQEHSGNRQQNDFPFGNTYETKTESSVFNETGSTFPSLHQQQRQHVPPLYHPQPQHRQPWRYGFARGAYPGARPEEEARIRIDADRLYNRFRKSDAYIKYRNRQTKEDKGNGDQKWPDHLERAFFRALVQYPPMGRRKQLHKNKQRGRNELIADSIEEHTGEARNRKQVSSHIQVLKPFVENDPYIMKWLAKEDIYGLGGRYQHGSSSYTGGRRSSNYPVIPPPSSFRTAMSALSLRTDLHDLQKVKRSLDIFEPIDFQMFVQRNMQYSDEHEEVQRLHTYTQAITNPLGPDLRLEDSQAFSQDFPLLAAMHAQRPLDCNVVAGEASLAFPMQTWKSEDGSPLPGVELGIYFLCTSSHLPPTPLVPTSGERAYQVIVHNTFYENGVAVKDHSGPSEARLEQSERGGVETRIKFGSTFWARTLGRLAGRLLDRSKDNSEEVVSYLSSINATQEIMAWSEQGAERLLVIHWKFRQSTSANGRTSWRKLLLPTHPGPYGPALQTERLDSIYGYDSQTSDVSTSQALSSQPTLQSPFEYESSSGSTLSSQTWQASFSDGGVNSQPHSNADFTADNSFDFNGGNINLVYDANLSFDGFDSSAYNFDASTASFAADSALQDYSQHWYDGYSNPFNGQQAVGGTDSFASQSELDGQGAGYEEYAVQYDQQPYLGSQDHQAYGGAGQEGIKVEDALAALADASFIASEMSARDVQQI